MTLELYEKVKMISIFHILDCCINSKKTVQEPSLTMKILIWKQSRSQLTFQDRQRMNYLSKNIYEYSLTEVNN